MEEKRVNTETRGQEVPLLEMRNITKIFPGVTALDNVSLTINEGEIHLLLGENGAGKSTMIKTIVGINQPEGGDMYWKGEKVKIKTLQEAYDLGIAVIYQELSNIPVLSVVENMYVGREIMKGKFIDWNKEREEARRALERVGLHGLDVDQPMGNLGVGHMQLVEIAKAIDRGAKLLIMDEPTSALSRKEIDFLLNLMKQLNEEGVSILFITHKLEEGKKVGHRVTVLRNGQNAGETRQVADVTEDDIIEMMVGHSLAEKFPERHVEIGEEVLRCEQLTGAKFEDISFNLHKGELLGFFGLVGAGRTETMRGIFGADPMVKGSVYLNGKELHIKSPQDAIKNGIVLVTENRKEEGLILIHSVIENGTIVTLDDFKKGALGLIDNKAREASVTEQGNHLNLKPMQPHKNAMDFSGGNQQKIVILKWMLANAQVFIFDEPTKGVDVGAKVEIYNIMNELLAHGASIIMVSSEMEEIMGMADRVLVMYEGEQKGLLPVKGTNQEDILALAIGD